MKQSTKDEIKIIIISLIIFMLLILTIYFFSGHDDIISQNAEKVAEMLRGGS
jgi:sensor histidine kinase regulating citrate/malate metabolism